MQSYAYMRVNTSDDSLLFVRRQAIILTNVDVGTTTMTFLSQLFSSSQKIISKRRLQNGGHFVPVSKC